MVGNVSNFIIISCWSNLSMNYRGVSEKWEEPWVDTETMGSRVVPSGVGSLDSRLSHPITLRAPPPIPSPNLPTMPLCSVGVTPPVALQWHHHWLLVAEWRHRLGDQGETEGMPGCSSLGGLCNHCAYFMAAPCHCNSHLRVSISEGGRALTWQRSDIHQTSAVLAF